MFNILKPWFVVATVLLKLPSTPMLFPQEPVPGESVSSVESSDTQPLAPSTLAQDVSSDASTGATPSLDEVMSRFAEIEKSYLPFHVAVIETVGLRIGASESGAERQSVKDGYRRKQYAFRDSNSWMEESVLFERGRVSSPGRVICSAGTVLRRPDQPEDSSGLEGSIEGTLRPVAGVFPLLSHPHRPTLVSDLYASNPKRFAMQREGGLLRVSIQVDAEESEGVRIELWLSEDHRWHPIRMLRFTKSSGSVFESEWSATTLRVSKDFVRIAAGRFSRTWSEKNEDPAVAEFVVTDFEIAGSSYGDNVSEPIFSADAAPGDSAPSGIEPQVGSNVFIFVPSTLEKSEDDGQARNSNVQSTFVTGSLLSGGGAKFGRKSAGGGLPVGSEDLRVSKAEDAIEDVASAEQVKIFPLKNSDAEDAGRIIESLFGFPTVKVATHDRSNSIIVSTDKKSLSEIEAVLMQLDQLPKAAIGGNGVKQSVQGPGDRENPVVSIAESRRRLTDLELPVLELAEKVRSAETSMGKDHPDSVKLRTELRTLVQKTFATRQEIQRAELAEFTRRLERMKQAIETREKIAEKIVDRRVEELLDPDARRDKAMTAISESVSRDELVASLNQKTVGLKNWKCSNASVQLSLPGILPQKQNGTVVCASPGQLRVTCDNFIASMDIGINKDTGWFYTKPGDSVFTTSWNTFVGVPRIGESEGWIIPSPMWMMTLLGVQPLDPERYELQKPASGSTEAWLVAMEEGSDGRLLRHIIKVDTVSSVIRSHTLYDGDGTPLLVAHLGEYKACGEFQLPNYLNVHFPTKSTLIEFRFADIETNSDLPDALWQRPSHNLRMVEIDPGSKKDTLGDAKTDGQPKIDSPEQSTGLPEKFHGEWKVEQLVVKSGDVDLSTILNPYLRISADHFVIPFDGNIRQTLAYTLLPETPTKVDLILDPIGSKRRSLGIIEVTDDTFKLCFREPADDDERALTESDRPRTFGPGSKIYLVECRREAGSPSSSVTDSSRRLSLDLSEGGATLSMGQRENRVIPGSSNSMSIRLSDITGGRVFVEIIDSAGKHVLERTPLKDKEFTEFRINDNVAYVQIADMRNRLIGEDICRVRLSFEKPEATFVSPGGSLKSEASIPVMLWSNRKFQARSGVTFADARMVQLKIPGESETKVQLTNIAGRHGLELAVAIDPVTSDADVFERLVSDRLIIEISNDDFDRFAKNEPIIRVIYLPTDPSASTTQFEQIFSWQLVPALDPVKVAEKRGKVAAVIRITPSQRPVIPIKNVAELEGKWRWLYWESVSASASKGRYDHNHLTLQLNRNPLQIADDRWIWNQPKRQELSTTYDFANIPQSVAFNDPVTLATSSHRRLIELSEDRLYVAQFLGTPDNPMLDEPLKSFDTPGILIETYQRVNVITAIDEGRKQVEISLGLSDDVKIGQRLGVASENQKNGTVEVVSVESDNCVARILETYPGRTIQKGNRIQILTDSTITEGVFPPTPKPEAKETNFGSFVSPAVDETSPPESDAEKAIARMVLVFFQDEARRAVPGLMIDHGTETLVLTTGPSTIVPDGVGHAIDRAFLEFPDESDVAAEFFNTGTADIQFHRAKPGLTKFKLEKTIDLAIGDSLSAIILSGRPTLRVTPNAARISALDQATSFSLATHKFRHEFSGLIQIDKRLPEGTPLFKNGELAGITLLGTRFMKDDVPGSYVVPASRILEVLQQQ